ncbi:MAG: hypothetical protein ACYS8Z_01685 [Planctomycetota bacterium]|jgi:hypothetical protein
MRKEKDKVLEITDIPKSDVGAPLPVVLSDEHHLFCVYYLRDTPDDWNGTNVKVMNIDSDDEPIAVAGFPGYHVYQFGPPNDETLHGHPLYSKGLEHYRVFEIANSSWIEYFERMNSVHPYHNKGRFEKYRHFIFSFHDSTLEVISENFEIEVRRDSIRQILSEIQNRLGPS